MSANTDLSQYRSRSWPHAAAPPPCQLSVSAWTFQVATVK